MRHDAIRMAVQSAFRWQGTISVFFTKGLNINVGFRRLANRFAQTEAVPQEQVTYGHMICSPWAGFWFGSLCEYRLAKMAFLWSDFDIDSFQKRLSSKAKKEIKKQERKQRNIQRKKGDSNTLKLHNEQEAKATDVIVADFKYLTIWTPRSKRGSCDHLALMRWRKKKANKT